MEGAWLISYAVLWALVLLLSVVLLSHSRLLGLLNHRFGPAAAKPLADGPEVGKRLENLKGRRVDGRPWMWEFPAQTEAVLIFLSPQCQTCDELIPHVKDFVRSHRKKAVILVSTVDHLGLNQAYVAYRRLQQFTYVVSAALAAELDIEGTPYALHLDCQGIVLAKGLVNHYEHLESLMRPPIPDTPKDGHFESETLPVED